MEAICFKSPLFQIEDGEDEETNPYRYGRQLANWLKGKLEVCGYSDLQVVPEDWGWSVIFSIDDITLLVGCGNMEDLESLENPELFKTKEIVWTCFGEAKVPFFKKLLNKLDPLPYEERLTSDLMNILDSTDQVEIIKCP